MLSFWCKAEIISPIWKRGKNNYQPAIPKVTEHVPVCLSQSTVVMSWLLASPCGGDVWRLGAVPGIMVLKLQHQFSSQWSQENPGLRMLSPGAGQSDNRVGFLRTDLKPSACSSDTEIRSLGDVSCTETCQRPAAWLKIYEEGGKIPKLGIV